ncbi:MAG: rhodanese-like domain-containing protein [Bacteroidetes bacterium]|nr:rhodanese-like domain-containing protein [Bacteroidota bacterium]
MKNLFTYLLIVPIMFLAINCSSDDGGTTPVVVNEAQVLAEYLEANGDFINTSAPALISADDVYQNMLTGASQYVIDIRAEADFANGHIQGAVNVSAGNLITHIEGLTTNYTTIVIACYSGQTASFGTSILRLLGHDNVKSLKFGMSSWNSSCANSWSPSIGNPRLAQFVTTSTPKGPVGELPTLATGEETGDAILASRAAAVLAEGFGASAVDHNTVYGNLSNYYIVNYWSADHYNLGHIDGAMQYTPGSDLKLATALKTLPTDKTIVVYCYTGQTSAHVAAYLKMLGYDAKTLKFGVNAMAYDMMPSSKWVDTFCKQYPFVQ